MALPVSIDALSIKISIQAAQSLLSPSQLETCLKASGIDMAVLNAATRINQHAVPVHEVTNFYRAIAATCGEATLRLLFNNLGTALAQSYILFPEFGAIKGRYSTLPLRTQVVNTLSDVTTLSRTAGWLIYGPEPVMGHENRWRLRVPDCIYCIDLQTKKPICATTISMYRQFLTWSCRAPVMVEEVECHATGQAACVHEVTLIE